MTKKPPSRLRRFASWISSPQQERTGKASSWLGSRIPAGFLVAYALLSIPFFGSIYRSVNFPTGFAPDTRIGLERWSVLYAPDAPPCGDDERFARAGCLAAPGNPKLWRSPDHRSDEAHFERSRQARGKELWLGTEIPVEMLREARAQGANQLNLGWFEGTYRIWIDGVSYGGTQGWNDIEMSVIELPITRLARPQPLLVAVQIKHDVDSIEPDMMNRYLGGEGFYTSERMHKLRARLVFWFKARPFALFITYVMLALAFFFFWLPIKLKKEYFYLSLYTLISAFNQARMMDVYFVGVSSTEGAVTRLLIELYTPLFGLFVGLAFARMRPVFFRFGVPLAIAAPILLAIGAGDTHARFHLCDFVRYWIAPPAMRWEGWPASPKPDRRAASATGSIARAGSASSSSGPA